VRLNDAHRLVCVYVRRVAARQVQSRQHVTAEIHPSQLGSTRPVLQPPSVHIKILFSLVRDLYHRTNTY
jgi:hypothetical protein